MQWPCRPSQYIAVSLMLHSFRSVVGGHGTALALCGISPEIVSGLQVTTRTGGGPNLRDGLPTEAQWVEPLRRLSSIFALREHEEKSFFIGARGAG